MHSLSPVEDLTPNGKHEFKLALAKIILKVVGLFNSNGTNNRITLVDAIKASCNDQDIRLIIYILLLRDFDDTVAWANEYLNANRIGGD